MLRSILQLSILSRWEWRPSLWPKNANGIDLYAMWYTAKSTSRLSKMWRSFWQGKQNAINIMRCNYNIFYDANNNIFFLFFFTHLNMQYTCLVCNLFDDDDKNQYHCDGCGICRIGGRNNFFHCEVCNMCLPLQLKTDGHRVSVNDWLMFASFSCLKISFYNFIPISILISIHFSHVVELLSFWTVCREYIAIKLSGMPGRYTYIPLSMSHSWLRSSTA